MSKQIDANRFYWDAKTRRWTRRAQANQSGVRLYWSETLKRWVTIPE